jgi:hypothetical protein
MDESSLTLLAGFEKLKADLAGLILFFSAWISETMLSDEV